MGDVWHAQKSTHTEAIANSRSWDTPFCEISCADSPTCALFWVWAGWGGATNEKYEYSWPAAIKCTVIASVIPPGGPCLTCTFLTTLTLLISFSEFHMCTRLMTFLVYMFASRMVRLQINHRLLYRGIFCMKLPFSSISAPCEYPLMTWPKQIFGLSSMCDLK